VVLLLVDGLGHDMVVDRPGDSPLRAALRGRLDASFSTQTSVATATLATGLPPSRHGLLGYLLDLPEAGGIVNTLWWMQIDGEPAQLDRGVVLPSPNLAERLDAIGVTSTVVEPGGYLGSPLDEVLYRGATTRGVDDLDQLVDDVVAAATPRSLVLGYLPHVDAAGHAHGPGSREHRGAINDADSVWRRLADRLPDSVSLVGTADHGMVQASEWLGVEPPEGVRIGGDSRVLYLYGDQAACEEFAATLPGEIITRERAAPLWGPDPEHSRFEARLPHLLVAASEGMVFHHPGNPVRLAGYHGGLSPAELEIPLLAR
jgi:hypothetical protein